MQSCNSRVLIISCFHEDIEISRSKSLFLYLKKKKYNVQVLYSKFSHTTRSNRIIDDGSAIPLKTIGYKKSISFKRLLSHFIFSVKAALEVFRQKPNLIVINIPPNATGWFCVLAAKLIGSKVVVDVVDLWPEALVGTKFVGKKETILPLLKVISRIGRLPIRFSDYCILECDLYRQHLDIDRIKNTTVHLKKSCSFPVKAPSDNISIAYLGGVSDIYDFETLFSLLTQLNQTCAAELHFIGDGPMREQFVQRVVKLNIRFVDHGVSFDDDYKYKCLSSCWFGYNGYNDTNFIGLSYKSVDYMSMGIPVLNNLTSDLHNIIEKEGGGLNFSSQGLDRVVAQISELTIDDITKLKQEALDVYRRNFSQMAYERAIDTVLNEMSLSVD